jgi:hypothetical protein
VSPWQPIKTAPKDETRIIGAHFGGYRDEWFLALIWWQPEFANWISGGRVMTMAPGYHHADGSSAKLHSPDIRNPTHWLPFEAPTEAELGAAIDEDSSIDAGRLMTSESTRPPLAASQGRGGSSE